MDEVEALVELERQALLEVLEQLDERQWDTPSLCTGWRVREVVVHLLMPYELPAPAFLLRLAAARFRFDTMADRDEAAELSAGAQALARERFGIERFVRDWSEVLHTAAGRR